MLINAILVIKNSSSSSFPLLSCFFPPNTRFSLLKTLFCPSKLNTSHLHGKKIFKLHCQVCKNKRAFFRRKTLSLHKIGCGSAKSAIFRMVFRPIMHDGLKAQKRLAPGQAKRHPGSKHVS